MSFSKFLLLYLLAMIVAGNLGMKALDERIKLNLEQEAAAQEAVAAEPTATVKTVRAPEKQEQEASLQAPEDESSEDEATGDDEDSAVADESEKSSTSSDDEAPENALQQRDNTIEGTATKTAKVTVEPSEESAHD